MTQNFGRETGKKNLLRCSANTSNQHWWGSHLSISWEAIFEVVAPSDVEDPRRPCRHGALCYLASSCNMKNGWILGVPDDYRHLEV